MAPLEYAGRRKYQIFMECTKFNKNLKSSKTANTSLLLLNFSSTHEKLQLDFARPLPGDEGKNFFVLVARDRYSKLGSVLLTKNTI